jgi:hypothetical protein
MMTVLRPISAALIPVAAATLVLPTPPLPAKKIILTKNSQKIAEGSGNLLSVSVLYHKAWIFVTTPLLLGRLRAHNKSKYCSL